jgi:hypothetical protein
MAPQIEFMWWQGCPSWERALEMLRAEVERLGLDPAAVQVIEVSDEAEAARRGFPGSPTIRVDGEDIQSPGHEQPGGLSCRVYRRRDGRVSPLPDPQDVRDALERSARKEAVSERG